MNPYNLVNKLTYNKNANFNKKKHEKEPQWNRFIFWYKRQTAEHKPLKNMRDGEKSVTVTSSKKGLMNMNRYVD